MEGGWEVGGWLGTAGRLYGNRIRGDRQSPVVLVRFSSAPHSLALGRIGIPFVCLNTPSPCISERSGSLRADN